MQALKKLSNQELETNLKDLVQKERKLLHVILEHIKEIDSRKLFLERAYSSLYEYLIKEFGYSGSAAMRRIEAARLLKEVPTMAQKIQEGTLNLSQIGELSRSIKEKEKMTGQQVSALQKSELVAKIESKTTLDTQKELALALDLPIKEFEKQKMQQDESLRLEITLSKEQYQKLLQCKDLAAHLLEQNHKDSSWASLFELLADQYLRKTFRKSTENSKTETSKEDTTMDVNTRLPASQTNSATLGRTDAEVNDHNKTLTPKTRKLILQRDACCQYRDPRTGKICQNTYGLQIDHKTSRWVGGGNEARNLQVLCGKHNRYKYNKENGLRNLL